MGKMSGWTLALIGVVVLVAVSGGVGEAITKVKGFFGGDSAAPSGDVGLGSGATASVCDTTTTPDLLIRAIDIDNSGTSLTEATNLYRKVGTIGWTTFTAGTAITSNLEVGAVYEIVMGVDTTDQTDNSYGPYFKTDPLPCRESIVIEKQLYQDEIETSLTATFYNADDAATTAEVFTAGQIQTVAVKFVAGNDEYFGNPYIAESGIAGPQRAAYPNVFCMDLNTTSWDVPRSVKYKGVEMNRVAVPLRHSAVAGHVAYCYEAPIIKEDSDKIFVTLDADDSNAPVSDESTYLYAGNFFINAKTSQVNWGVEDEDGNAAGTDASDTIDFDFT